jgi:UDP-GlcNAc:undecaprenyl-phosphate GlcNAc-1-phosphate transferase
MALLSGFSCLLAWGFGLYITPLAMKAARNLGCLSRPDGWLRTQDEPVPYLGGVAIFLALLLSLALSSEFSPVILGLLLGATIMLMVGLIDDFGVMAARMKLFGQIIVALTLIKSGIVLELAIFDRVRWPFGWPALSWGLSALWLIGLANAFNFLDIEDGLAGGVAACLCPALFVVAILNGRIDAAIFTAALFGACLGFLHFNAPVPKARIYLGDAGSLLLGVVLASLAMMGSYTAKNDIAAICPVIILGVPCFELGLTMAARRRRGIPVYYGSPDHVAKRLQKASLSKTATLGLHCITSLILGGLALVIMNTNIKTAIVLVVILAAVALVAGLLLLRVQVEAPEASEKGKKNES